MSFLYQLREILESQLSYARGSMESYVKTIVLKSIPVRHILARVGVKYLAQQQVTNQAHYSSSRVTRDLIVNEGEREEESPGSAILLGSSRYGHSSFSHLRENDELYILCSILRYSEIASLKWKVQDSTKDTVTKKITIFSIVMN